MTVENNEAESSVKGLKELEAREASKEYIEEGMYTVTLRVVVRVRVQALAAEYALEDASTAVKTVLPTATQLPHPDVFSLDVIETIAEEIEGEDEAR